MPACAECGGNKVEISSTTKKCTSCDKKNNNETKEDLSSMDSGVDSTNADISKMKPVSDEILFQNPPPKEDCQICFLPMPHCASLWDVEKMYKPCCGKMLCTGCFAASWDEMCQGNMKRCCPFCMVPMHNSPEEQVDRYKKRMELGDSYAIFMLGDMHRQGVSGLPKDMNKAMEYYFRAAELGSSMAHYNIANEYYFGKVIEKDMEKAIYHVKLAAIGGHEVSRHNLGTAEANNGNMDRAIKHWIIAAKSGYNAALKSVQGAVRAGYVSRDEYMSILSECQSAYDSMRSEQRDKAART